jgi:hypothetical protein
VDSTIDFEVALLAPSELGIKI